MNGFSFCLKLFFLFFFFFWGGVVRAAMQNIFSHLFWFFSPKASQLFAKPLQTIEGVAKRKERKERKKRRKKKRVLIMLLVIKSTTLYLLSGCFQLFDKVLSLIGREMSSCHPFICRPYPWPHNLFSQKLGKKHQMQTLYSSLLTDLF